MPPSAPLPRTTAWSSLDGVGVAGTLQAAAFLFFAFAGYARIATLGEEVRDPARTIPRAIPVALGIALAVYAAVAVALLAVLGPTGIAETSAPLAAAARASGWAWVEPLVRVGAVVAAVGSLLVAAARRLTHHARDGPRRAPAARASPPCIRATRCRTTPSSLSARSSSWWCCSPTCARRSGSPPSPSWPTTRSPTPPP